MQEPKGRREWGWRRRGEYQGRGRDDTQRGGGGKEEDGSDGDNGGTGERNITNSSGDRKSW